MPDRAAPRHAPTPPARPRRRHPARSARLAAIGMSIASALGLTAFFDRTGASAGAAVGASRVVTASVPPPSSTPSTGSAPARSTTSTSTRATTSTTVARHPSVVDGAPYANRWGDVQVEVTFGSDGSIQSADAIQSPDSHGRSVEINDRAVPVLDAEVVSAQSAQVHTVSGATYTSESYRSSLQSAIDTARRAGLTTLT